MGLSRSLILKLPFSFFISKSLSWLVSFKVILGKEEEIIKSSAKVVTPVIFTFPVNVELPEN